MINNNKLRHFEIIDYRDKVDKFDMKILDDLNDNYLKSIEDLLIPWIETQHKTCQLFEKSNWKPFRDQEDRLSCVLGYKILFQYNKYYFSSYYCKYEISSLSSNFYIHYFQFIFT